MKKYIEVLLDSCIEKIKKAEAILVGVGAGLSTASWLSYSGERFERYFSDFRLNYGITNMYEGGFYPFNTKEEYWAWWSRHVLYNRYEVSVGTPYTNLLEILKDKNYFILSTNVDHQLQKAGFSKDRMFSVQGDFGLWQCSVPCHNKTYNNEESIRKMVACQKNCKIPSSLIPYCPICMAPLTMNLRIDDKFVEDESWHKEQKQYQEFLERYQDTSLVCVELGVGLNTPGIIKYPFMQMTLKNEIATYININIEEFFVPKTLVKRSINIIGDIKECLTYIKDTLNKQN